MSCAGEDRAFICLHAGCAGMSLVPLADIFNHKAAIVWLSDEYAIEPVCFEDTYESGSEDEAAAACEGNGCREPGCTGEPRTLSAVHDLHDWHALHTDLLKGRAVPQTMPS